MMPVQMSASVIGQALANHVWQSTLCLAAAALVVLALRRYEARWRFVVWSAASIKFLVPFAFLVSVGASMPSALVTPRPLPRVSLLAESVGQPFSTWTVVARPSPIPPRPVMNLFSMAAAVAIATWFCGAVVALGVRVRRLRRLAGTAGPTVDDGRVRAALVEAQETLRVDTRVRLVVSSAHREPGVSGIFRPVIVWPARLADKLGDDELGAVLAHELIHVRRRDNFVAALHWLVESIFWFYPPVTWLGSRLVEERERTCDQEVRRLGIEPRTYAESILKVGRFCLQSPAATAVMAATGSNLAHRLEEIMSYRVNPPLGPGRRLLLMATAVAVLIAPVGAGALHLRAEDARLAQGFVLAAQSPQSSQDDRRPSETVAAVTTDPATPKPVAKPPIVTAAPARTQDARGTILGQVTDQTGAPVAGALVTIPIPTTAGQVSTLKATGDGTFFMGNVPAGDYEFRVEAPGFRSTVTHVELLPGQTVTANIQLGIGAVSESITTTPAPAGAPLPDEAALRDQIATNPQNASGYLNLADLYLREGRTADAERLLAQGLDLYRQQVASRAASGLMASAQGGGNIKRPTKVRDVRPAYPAEAVAAHTGGLVVLEATIAADGTVKDPRVIRSAPPFDQPSLDAVRQWLFTPTLLNGVAVDVLMTVTLNFPAQ
jgi:TonB family protein